MHPPSSRVPPTHNSLNNRVPFKVPFLFFFFRYTLTDQLVHGHQLHSMTPAWMRTNFKFIAIQFFGQTNNLYFYYFFKICFISHNKRRGEIKPQNKGLLWAKWNCGKKLGKKSSKLFFWKKKRHNTIKHWQYSKEEEINRLENENYIECLVEERSDLPLLLQMAAPPVTVGTVDATCCCCCWWRQLMRIISATCW